MESTPLCALCPEEGAAAAATLRCLKCDVIMCDACSAELHGRRAFRLHPLTRYLGASGSGHTTVEPLKASETCPLHDGEVVECWDMMERRPACVVCVKEAEAKGVVISSRFSPLSVAMRDYYTKLGTLSSQRHALAGLDSVVKAGDDAVAALVEEWEAVKKDRLEWMASATEVLADKSTGDALSQLAAASAAEEQMTELAEQLVSIERRMVSHPAMRLRVAREEKWQLLAMATEVHSLRGLEATALLPLRWVQLPYADEDTADGESGLAYSRDGRTVTNNSERPMTVRTETVFRSDDRVLALQAWASDEHAWQMKHWRGSIAEEVFQYCDVVSGDVSSWQLAKQLVVSLFTPERDGWVHRQSKLKDGHVAWEMDKIDVGDDLAVVGVLSPGCTARLLLQAELPL
eukprot:PLAT7084.1.p1 GENE.PLAT7084.1~~PLAT7084.1.p1  ORF type:complete len:412 (+),score=96.15 PLAT7084.1:27-1238(+)